MRSEFFVLLLTCAGMLPALPASASEGVDDIVRLAQNSVGEDVVRAFIENSGVAYDLTVDEILLLHDLGHSSKIITAMLEHGRLLRLRQAKVPALPIPPDPPPFREAQVEPPPEPLPMEVVRTQPVYEYRETQPTARTVVVERYEPEVVYGLPEDQYNVSFFYESLSPYGSWVMTPDYGWCWQPTVVRVDPHWRPYCHGGQWVWTDHGWYWHSTYSWGWAPFHYGRWVSTPAHNWVWVPDTTWGPSWVHWRHGGEHCGWAPLPPGSRYETGVGFSWHGKHIDISFNFGLRERDYCFVPERRFRDRDLAPVVLQQPTHVTNVYNNSTTINNTYIYNDNRIINRGVPVQSVAQAAGTASIQPVQVTDATVKPGDPITPERATGNQIVSFRPRMTDKAPETPDQVAVRRKAVMEKWQREKSVNAPELDRRSREIRMTGIDETSAAKQAELEARQKFMAEQARRRSEMPLQLEPVTAPAVGSAGTQPNAPKPADRRPPLTPRKIAEYPDKEGSVATAKQKAEDDARKQALADAHTKRVEDSAKRRGETVRQPGTDDLRRPGIEALRKTEEHAQPNPDEQARKRAETDSRRRAEDDVARKQAEVDSRRKAEENAKFNLEEQARQRTHTEAKRNAEEEVARKRADNEARNRREDAARRLVEGKAARHVAEVEAESQRKTQESAKMQVEEEARRRAEQEQQRRTTADRQVQAEMEVQRRAPAEDARKRGDAEAMVRQQADEARRREEATTRGLVEAEGRRRSEIERQHHGAEDAVRKQAELEAQRRAVEDARKQADAATLESNKKSEEAKVKEEVKKRR